MYTKTRAMVGAGIVALLLSCAAACSEDPDASTPPPDPVPCVAMTSVGCGAPDEPQDPLPPWDPYEPDPPAESDKPEDPYEPNPDSTNAGVPDDIYTTPPPRNPCDSYGAIGCPGNPIKIPPPNLEPWS